MILKELDPFSSADVLEKAGRQAEEQMAFYLRRAFKDEPDTFSSAATVPATRTSNPTAPTVAAA